MGRLDDIDDLLPVPDEAFILRRIPRGTYDPDAQDGKYLARQLFVVDPPSDDTYGPSVYVESRLRDGIQSLIAIDSAWHAQGVVRIQVRELRQFELEVRYSPADCTYDSEELRGAHATVLGLTRPRRNQLVAHLTKAHVLRPPVEPV
jgi:hypothetical protein